MSELDKKDDFKSNFLEWGGIFIILITIAVVGLSLITKSCNKIKNENVYLDTIQVSKVNFFEISKKKLDTSDIALSKELLKSLNQRTDSINSKIEQINSVSSDLREIQKENVENFRFYLTLIGFIFAIVGFFGFKSIFDTRQGAIDRAIIEARDTAKIEAKEIAKIEAKIASLTEARTISQQVAEEVAEKTAQKIAEIEANKFFSDTFQKLFNEWEQTYKSSIDDQFTEILDDINKLKRPEAYGIVDAEKDKLKKRLKEFEEKQSELLQIITEIKLKFLKD